MTVSALFADTQFALERLPHYLKLKTLGNGILNPFIRIHLENAKYEVKTLENPEELLEVLSLRYEVFFREFSARKTTFSLFPYDVDVHDFICDHLVVKDKSTGSIVACYRLLPSSQLVDKKHYTENEFILKEFLQLPGEKLELGRACVHREYRNGEVISMLWKGLCAYARRSGAKYLFGCTSINRKDFEFVPGLMNYLEEKGSLIQDFSISAKGKYRMESNPKAKLPVLSPKVPALNKGMGSLMHMYLLAGARLGKELAYDEEMDCLDIFTIVDFTRLPTSFERRFS